MSNINTLLEIFRKYAPLMNAQEYPCGNAILVLNDGGDLYSTKAGANFDDLTEADIDKNILNFIPDGGVNKAMVLFNTPSAKVLLERRKNFKPALDDMAQIIGPCCKYFKQVPNKLGQNAGCFVENVAGQSYCLTVGRTLYEAIVAMTVLEKSASVSLLAEKLGGEKPLGGLETRLMRFVYRKKYSKAEVSAKSGEQKNGPETVKDAISESISKGIIPPSYSEKELALRESLVEYGKKLVETGLVQGTWGNLSARLNEEFMLVTPSGLDYTRLTPDDMVKVEIKTLNYEGSLKPTSEKGLHAEVYSRRPKVGAIIHTHAKFASVFAAAEKDLSSEVKLAGYGLAGTKALKNHTADALGKNYGTIMSHHGMLVVGDDLEEAFANCQKLEAECESALK